MSKEYAVYNWLTSRITSAGGTVSGAERVKVGLMEADPLAGPNGDNLEIVTVDDAWRLRVAFTYGVREGRREAYRQGVWVS